MSKLETKIGAGQFVITAEIVPPLSAGGSKLLAEAELLAGKVDAINVTDAAAGRTTMSSFAAAAILAANGHEPILQVTCRDRNRIALAGDLIGAAAQGVQNLLILKGDDPKGGDQPDAKPVFDYESSQLLSLARDLRDRGMLAVRAASRSAAAVLHRRRGRAEKTGRELEGCAAAREDRSRRGFCADAILLRPRRGACLHREAAAGGDHRAARGDHRRRADSVGEVRALDERQSVRRARSSADDRATRGGRGPSGGRPQDLRGAHSRLARNSGRGGRARDGAGARPGSDRSSTAVARLSARSRIPLLLTRQLCWRPPVPKSRRANAGRVRAKTGESRWRVNAGRR